MHHTLREQQTLRLAHRYHPRRRMTVAGRFWVGYAIALLLGAYLIADWVTRVAS